MNLSNKRIVVTGGTSGIGRELVRRLHGNNELVVIARSATALANLQQECPGIAVLEADLSNGEQVGRAGAEIAKRYERVDVLVNNAAVQSTPTFLDDDFDYDTIAAQIAVNLTSPCQLVARLLPGLLAAPQAMIVNVNSGLALVPKKSSAVYCATKGGLNIFSLSLAHQLEATDIRVRQVFLPLVDTAMTHGRGTGKLTAREAADRIITGMQGDRDRIDIGKVALLRWLDRIAPPLARTIMKSA